jgi:hypothetical protein
MRKKVELETWENEHKFLLEYKYKYKYNTNTNTPVDVLIIIVVATHKKKVNLPCKKTNTSQKYINNS